MQQSSQKTTSVKIIQQYPPNISHRHPQSLDFISDFVGPETALEKAIIKNEAWIEGAFWGEPRPGHPEGKIIYHIREVLDNVDKIGVHKIWRQQLRLITLIHDTFKHLEEKTRPRQDWNKHHAVYAMRFAENFIAEQHILDIIELHDEAYYAWGIHHYKGNEEKAMKRLNSVIHRLAPEHLQLFYLFFKCDTGTGDKTQSPVKWFEENVKGIEVVNW